MNLLTPMLGLLLTGVVSSVEVDVTGASGGSNTAQFLRKWMRTLEARAKNPIHLGYRSVGTAAGWEYFNNGTNDKLAYLGSGDLPLSSTLFSEADYKTDTILHIPYALGTISVFVNVPGVSSIRLSPCTLANILRRAITTWSHADIIKENPHVGTLLAGQTIMLGMREDGSGSSAVLTAYLSKMCPERWTDAASPDMPAVVNGTATRYVKDVTAMARFVKDTSYSIGYLSSGLGMSEGLTEVELLVDATSGAYSVASAMDVTAAANVALPATGSRDWVDFTLSQTGTWPMTTFSYFYVHAVPVSEYQSMPLIRACVEFMLSDEAQNDLKTYGFTKLPDTVMAASLQAVAQIALDAASLYSFETDDVAEVLLSEMVISNKRDPYPVDLEQLKDDVDDVQVQASRRAEELADIVALVDNAPSTELQEHIVNTLTNLPVGLSDHASVFFSGKIFVIGGCIEYSTTDTCSKASSSIYEFSRGTGVWTELNARLTVPRYGHGVGILNGVLHVIGGASDVEALNTVDTLTLTNGVATVSEVILPNDKFARVHLQVFRATNQLYVCGGAVSGHSAADEVNTCVAISESHYTVSDAGSMVTARSRFSIAVNHAGDEAYAYGGVSGRGTIGHLEVWKNNAWSLTEITDSVRVQSAASAYFNQQLFLFGGKTDDGKILNSVTVFDPATKKWSKAGGLPVKAERASAVAVGESVYYFGGKDTTTLSTTFAYQQKPDLHELATVQIHGSGTTNPSRFFRKWANVLESRIKFPALITYRAVGSGAGQSDFQVVKDGRPAVDFACGDIPLTEAAYKTVTETQLSEVLHVPFALGSISLFHSAPDVSALQLKPCTLARIFSGEYATWGAALSADGQTVPKNLQDANLRFGLRKGGSSSSYGLSEYLSKACPSVWKHTPSANFPVPSSGSFVLVEGSSKMTAFINENDYALGYLDSGHGQAEGLREVSLEVQTDSGTAVYQVASQNGVRAAASDVSPPSSLSSWAGFSLQNRKGAWPITMVSYFYLRKDMTGHGVGASLLRAFMEHTVLSEEGQADLEKTYGFVSLPDSMRALSLDTVRTQLELPNAVPQFVLETSTMSDGEGNGDFVISTKRNPKPHDLDGMATTLKVLDSAVSVIGKEEDFKQLHADVDNTKAQSGRHEEELADIVSLVNNADTSGVQEHLVNHLQSLPVGLSDHASVFFSGKIFVIGGCIEYSTTDTCSKASSSIYEFSRGTGVWTELNAKLTVPRYGHGVGILNGVLHVIGGASDVEALNTVDTLTLTNGVATVSEVILPNDKFARVHLQVFRATNQLYVCGGAVSGHSAADEVNTCVAISESHYTVSDAGSMVTARSRFSIAVNHAGDEAYAYGGVSGSGTIGQLEVWKNNAWSLEKVEDSERVQSAASAYFNQQLFLFGGKTDDGKILNSVTVFDPATKKWSKAGGLPVKAERASAVAVGESVYYFGGKDTTTLSTTFAYQQKPDLHELATVQIHGSGTTNPSRFFRKWANVLESRIKFPALITYRAVGSGAGQSDFQVVKDGRPAVDFACGDIPLTEAAYKTVTETQLSEVLHVPFALGSISLFHSAPDVSALQLKPCTLARIFSGEYATWGAALSADGQTVPKNLQDANLRFGLRKGGSSSSYGLSEYLSKACPSVWKHTPSANFPVPSSGSFVLVEGSSKMTAFINENDYALGYLDSGHGQAEGLHEVSLEVQTDSGTAVYQVASQNGVRAAASDVSPPSSLSSWAGFSLQNRKGAWPITMVSYFYLRKDMTGHGVGASLLRAFMEHTVLSEEGQADLEKTYGFVSLPDSMRALSLDTVRTQLELPNAVPQFVLETSTMSDGEGNGDFVISTKRNPKPHDLDGMATTLKVLDSAVSVIGKEEDFKQLHADVDNTKAQSGRHEEELADIVSLVNNADTSGVQEHLVNHLQSLPVGLSDHASVFFSGKIFVIGGCIEYSTTDTCSKASSSIYEFSRGTGVWTELNARLTVPRYGHGVGILNGVLHVIGGASDVEALNTVDTLTLTNGVATVSEVILPNDKFARVHLQVFRATNQLYVCGGAVSGHSAADEVNTCVAISESHYTVSDAGSMVTARSRFSIAVNHAGDEAYAYGGVSGSGTIGQLEVWKNNAWSLEKVEDSERVQSAASAYFNQQLFLFGGKTDDGKILNSVTVFDPATKKWSKAGGLPVKAERASAVAVGESVYYFGGKDTTTLSTTFAYQQKPDLHELATVQIHGSGTTNPSRFFRKWANVLESRIKFPALITYRAVGSGAGQSDFQVVKDGMPAVDFACGDIPLTEAAYKTVTETQLSEVLHVPFALGSISLFHSALNVSSLQLKPCTLARIFSGEYATWGAALSADGQTVPKNLQDANLRFGLRKGGSSSSYGLSEYLSKACPSVWKHTPSANFPVPSSGSFVLVEGSSKMTAFINENDYALGYLDSGHGQAEGLREVSLEVQTDSGTAVYQVASQNGVRAAASDVSPPSSLSSWAGFSLQNRKGAWPITMVSYFYLRKDMTGHGVGASLLRAFMEHTVLSEEGQADLEKTYGFVSLPDSMRALSLDTVRTQLELPNAVPQFVLETSTMSDGEGNGDFVISTKRNPKPHDLDGMATALKEVTKGLSALGDSRVEVSVLLRRVQDISDRVDDLSKALRNVPSAPPASPIVTSSSNDTADEARTLALVAIAFCCCVLIVSLAALAMAYKAGPGSKNVHLGATEPSITAD